MSQFWNYDGDSDVMIQTLKQTMFEWVREVGNPFFYLFILFIFVFFDDDNVPCDIDDLSMKSL